MLMVGYQAAQELAIAPSSNLAEAGLFLQTGLVPQTGGPDLQFHLVPLLYVNPAFFREGPGFTFVLNVAQPQSRGSLRLRSPHAADPPVIRAHYLQSGMDMALLVAGVKLARRLAQTRALAAFRGEEIAPGPTVQSDAAVRAYIRQTADSIHHPVGTCKMGHDRLAVVNPQLQVHGVEGIAGGRCVDHADHHGWEHERSDYHDWRKGRGYDSSCAQVEKRETQDWMRMRYLPGLAG